MNIRYPFIIVLLLLISISVKSQTTIHLFNQKDLDGWYAYKPDSGVHKNAEDLFSVENGIIRFYGKKPGYLMSDKTFRDFKLTVEFRWNADTTFPRKSNSKNSGVMYFVPQGISDTLWPAGIQFQIKDGAYGDFILLHGITVEIQGKRTEPGRSVHAEKKEDVAISDSSWNTIVITSQDGKITQELNGILVNECSAPSVSEGRILLQYEGFPIDFRKVDIEILN